MNAYVHWGQEFVEKLNGIFAFVIFDEQRGRVVAGRDRFGAKPLHYSEIEGHVVFSSEYRVIQQLRKPLRDDLDPGAVTAYMQCRFVPRHRSVISGIAKLKPGGIQPWDVRNLSTTSRIFWTPRYSPEPFRPQVFLAKLLQAVQLTSALNNYNGFPNRTRRISTSASSTDWYTSKPGIAIAGPGTESSHPGSPDPFCPRPPSAVGPRGS